MLFHSYRSHDCLALCFPSIACAASTKEVILATDGGQLLEAVFEEKDKKERPPTLLFALPAAEAGPFHSVQVNRRALLEMLLNLVFFNLRATSKMPRMQETPPYVAFA